MGMQSRSTLGGWRVRPDVKARIRHIAHVVEWSESQLVDAALTEFINKAGRTINDPDWRLEQWPLFSIEKVLKRKEEGGK